MDNLEMKFNLNENMNNKLKNENQVNEDSLIKKNNQQIISLNNIILFFRNYMYFLISGLIILISYLLLKGNIFSFLLGVICTILIQIVLMIFIFGIGISDKKDDKNEEKINNQQKIKSSSEEDILAEERKNDLQITYNTIKAKNLSNIDKNESENFSISNLNSPHQQEMKFISDETSRFNITELDLNQFNLDPSYYCYCKFMPENFEKLIKMQNDIINNYSDSIVKSLTDMISNVKLFQNVFRKKYLYNKQVRQIDVNFEKEKNIHIDYQQLCRFTEGYNKDFDFLKKIYIRSNEVIDTIHNLVISNLKGVNSQSITEKNHFFKEIKSIVNEINSKENFLRQTLEKYYSNKKQLEKLSNNLETSKINNVKYEHIVKIEMQIKIATKQINETQTVISLAADNFKESRINFTENSLKIYLNFMKNITREYEVLRALLLSFFEFFKELISNFKHEFFNKNNNQLIELDESLNNIENNGSRKDSIIINNVFLEFIGEYFYNVNQIKIQFFHERKFNSRNETIDPKDHSYQELLDNKLKNNFSNNFSINANLYDKNKFLSNTNFNNTNNLIKNNKDISENQFILNNEVFFIENLELLQTKDMDFMKEINKMQIRMTASLNHIKEFFEIKINLYKKYLQLIKNYSILSNQIKSTFTEFNFQNKRTRKNKINNFFRIFDHAEHTIEIDQKDSVNLNFIFIKIFNISERITDDSFYITTKFNQNINNILKVIGFEDKKNDEMLKFFNVEFNNFNLEAEKIFKNFLDEVNSLSKDKINNKNLFNLKLRKVAEDFIIRNYKFIQDLSHCFIAYDKNILKNYENAKSFNKEFNSLKSDFINSLNKNCFDLINILEKSSQQLSNFYDIDEEIKNIDKLKKKINNEILELIVFNKDYKLGFIHDKKCSNYNKLDRQNFNFSKNKIERNPFNDDLILLNEDFQKKNHKNIQENNEIVGFQNSLLNNFKDKKNDVVLETSNLIKDRKIKNSYFQKIKNFILKKTWNRRMNEDQIPEEDQKIKIDKINNKVSTREIIKDIDDIISNIENKEKCYENYAINNKGYLTKEEANWFNRLLETFFQRWKENDFFKKWFRRLLYTIYNKKRPQNLDTIWIDDIQFSGSAPEIKVFKELEFERTSPYEFLYDIEISYKGTTKLFLSTMLFMKVPYVNKILNIPLNIVIDILSLNGIVRLYYNGNQEAESWYAFLGEPVINFDINIVIGENYKIDINVLKIKNFLKRSIKKRFRKYSLPNKRPLTIPLTIDPSTLGVPEKVGNPKKR